MSQTVISDECACHTWIDGLIYCHIRAHVVGHFTGLAGCLSLNLHALLESFFIHIQILLLQDFFRQIKRESVCVVETESILSVQSLLSLCLHLIDHIRQNAKPLVDRLVELLFLFGDHLQYELLLLLQLRISVLGSFNDSLCQLRKESLLDAKQSSMTAGTSEQTAEHISSSFVGRHDSVRDHKCYGTDVVCDDTDGHICLIFFLIFHTGKAAHMIAESLDGIHIENGIHILHDGSQTLQAHSRIDVLLLQLCIMSLAVIIELAEHVVPDLHVAVAVTSYRTARLAAAVLLTSVIIYF